MKIIYLAVQSLLRSSVCFANLKSDPPLSWAMPETIEVLKDLNLKTYFRVTIFMRDLPDHQGRLHCCEIPEKVLAFLPESNCCIYCRPKEFCRILSRKYKL